MLVLAQRLLDAPAEEAQDGDALLEHFMTMDGDGLSITDATVDNLLVLAEETPRDLGVDLRATWRNNAWDSQTDNHHFDENALRFGVIWDVVADGFLDTRREAQDYHDRFRLAQMDANASRQGERFIYRDVLMAMHFAALRLGPLDALRLLQQARLDELIALYHSGRVFLDDVIEAQGELAETTAHINAIHYALDQLPQYQPPLQAHRPPVLDLNMDALARGLRDIATQDGQRLALQESILRRKYDKAYDIDLEVFSDIGSQMDRDGRDEDFRLGLDLRIPIATSSERLLRSSMRKERVAPRLHTAQPAARPTAARGHLPREADRRHRHAPPPAPHQGATAPRAGLAHPCPAIRQGAPWAGSAAGQQAGDGSPQGAD